LKNTILDSEKAKARLEALSDGIFAITMTMMIIDLKIPENSFHNLNPSELNNALIDLIPAIRSYLLSFFILAIFWMRQQIHLNYLEVIEKHSILIYIVFLLLIGFVPFTVNLIKRYPEYHTPFILYSLNLLLLSVILYLNTFFTYRKNIKENKQEKDDNIEIFLRISGITVLIFFAGFIISFFNIEIAFFVILIDPVFYFLYRRIGKAKVRHKSN
jgi:uncharacterized membrane protein